jgi:hypothetical protein
MTYLEFLPENYYDVIRGKLGADDTELTDTEIDNTMFIEQTEFVIKKRVPDFLTITDAEDQFHIMMASLCYICAMLCPIMPRKVNKSVKTIDVTWDKFKMDYDALAMKLFGDFENELGLISTVTVTEDIAPVLGGKTSNTLNPMGMVSTEPET